MPVPATSRQKASGKVPVSVPQSVSKGGRVDEATKRSGENTFKEIDVILHLYHIYPWVIVDNHMT